MKTLGQFITHQAKKLADKNFLLYKSEGKVTNESYRDFYFSALGWAMYIKGQDVKSSDRVMVISTKSPSQIRAIYGTWLADCIVVPVCETLNAPELLFITKDCQPSLILIEDKLFTKTQTVLADFKCCPFDDVCDFDQLHHDSDRTYIQDPKLTTDSAAVLIYTSGSTGNPKGVITTHQNLLVNASSASRHLQLGSDEIVMSVLPYWHTFALTVELVFILETGGSIVLVKDQRDFMRGLNLYKPTIILAVPRVLQAMKDGILKKIAKTGNLAQKSFSFFLKNSKKNLNSSSLITSVFNRLGEKLFFNKIKDNFPTNFKGFVVGGAPLDNDLANFFNALKLPVYLGYGLSETSPIVSINGPEFSRLGSSGKLIDWLSEAKGGDFTFMDAKGNCAKDIVGELLVKGKCTMAGYWGHADESAKVVQDGWLHTGDVACLDDEGYLFIKGRSGNMLVLAGGENLHPEHIEELIKQSDYISEAMVIGDNCKNPYVLINLTEAGLALEGEQRLAVLKKEILRLTNGLVNFKRPKQFLVLPEFNREDGTYTSILKIRRYRILELYKSEINDFLTSNEK